MVVRAQEETRLLNHDHIGAEHLLLGLIHEDKGVAATVLKQFGISLGAARTQVAEISQGKSSPSPHPPFTTEAKKVLEGSLREAFKRGDTHIGTEHILLAALQDGAGMPAQVLEGLAADPAQVREQVGLLA